MKLNPNKEEVKNINYALKMSGGYCPCHPEEHGNPDWMCPCKEMIINKVCCCGLYVRK